MISFWIGVGVGVIVGVVGFYLVAYIYAAMDDK